MVEVSYAGIRIRIGTRSPQVGTYAGEEEF